MALKAVFLGHWRALEEKWLDQTGKVPSGTNVAVVTAGQKQSERLASLLPGTTAGLRFFPGIPKFAEAVSNRISAEDVPAPAALALAYLAGYSSASAPSAAGFFERLLDNGITAELFRLNAMSMKPADPEVIRTAGLFTGYQELRDSHFPCTSDSIVRSGEIEADRFRAVMLYGFYDLNPGQRNFIRRLASFTDVFWFSPVHPSHHWSNAYTRTLEFLNDLSEHHIMNRADRFLPLSPTAQFAENMLTGKALVRNGSVHLVTCGSGTAFTSAVASRILSLDIPVNEAAVVASGDDAEKIRIELYSRGIPCATDLKLKAEDLPFGAFTRRLAGLGERSFHHTDIQNLLAYGSITAQGTPGPAKYAEQVKKTGGRFGLDGLRDTGFHFASSIAGFFADLPETGKPEEYLNLLIGTLHQLCPDSIPDYLTGQVLLPGLFDSPDRVVFPVFRRMLDKALEAKITVADKDRNGIHILSPEQIRGSSYRIVILTGLEEGRFPGRTVNDPRLPVKMKELLEMSSPDNREHEDAFLLRQVFESASERVYLLVKTVDEKGNAVSPSPFLAPLEAGMHMDRPDPVTREDNTILPSDTLSFPEEPPFLTSSLTALKERISYDPEEPRENQDHSGMIGPGYYDPPVIHATKLENYHRNRFGFLERDIWRVSEPDAFPVRSEPDGPSRGILIHRCVEEVLSSGKAPEDVVAGLSEEADLKIMLGSPALAEIWRSNTVKGIVNLQRELRARELIYRSSELSLEGTVAGLPAAGRIDLIFTTPSGELVLADLKTGRTPKTRSVNPVSEKAFQLPFYFELARQNLTDPVSYCCYLHLEGSGELKVREITADRILEQMDDFHQLVRETCQAMRLGRFPVEKPKSRRRE